MLAVASEVLTCLDCDKRVSGRRSPVTGQAIVRCNSHARSYWIKRGRENRNPYLDRIKDEIAEVGIDEFCRRRLTDESLAVPVLLIDHLREARVPKYRQTSMLKGHWTGRRLEILRLISEGRENPEIAAALGIAHETVKSHVRTILDLLAARNRAHAVHVAYRLGLLRRR